MAEDESTLGQRPSFRQTIHRELLSHLQDVGFGDRRFHDIGVGRFTGFELGIFHAGIPITNA